MPLRPGNRYLSFLVVSGVAVSIIALQAKVNKEGMAAVLVGIGLLLRQEYADRRARQSRSNIHGKLDEIRSTAEVVKEDLATAAEVVKRQTNGELDQRFERLIAKHLTPLVEKVACLESLSKKLEDLDAYVHKMKHDLVQKPTAERLERELDERIARQDATDSPESHG